MKDRIIRITIPDGNYDAVKGHVDEYKFLMKLYNELSGRQTMITYKPSKDLIGRCLAEIEGRQKELKGMIESQLIMMFTKDYLHGCQKLGRR